MSRDEEASLNFRAQEAKRRLCSGIESCRGLIEQYRARLLAMKTADELRRGRLLLASGSPTGRL